MTTTKPPVGLIGPGLMGAPIAANLLTAGYEVAVYGRSAERVDPLVDQGARRARVPREVAAPVVLAVLPDVPHLRALLDGPDGLLAGLAPLDRPRLVVMSTTSPAQITALAADLAGHDVALVDAPMSGGDKGAQEATMSIMAGGAQQDIDAVMPVLHVIGGTVVHMGATGAGALMKLCNQVVVAGTLAATAEALAMAESGGLDPRAAATILQGGLASSAVLDLKGAHFLDREYTPGGSASNQLKDLRYGLDTFVNHGDVSPVTALLTQLFLEVERRGWGDQDHSVVRELYAPAARGEG